MKTLEERFEVTAFKTAEPLILCVGINHTVKRTFYEVIGGGDKRQQQQQKAFQKVDLSRPQLEAMTTTEQGGKFLLEDWYISAPGE